MAHLGLMDVVATDLPGASLLIQDRHRDHRGWFARTWCAQAMRAAGLADHVEQLNFSCSERAGTLRGLHWQVEPHAEDKVVWVARGAIWDVAVDVRRGSPTFGRWTAAELSAANGRGLAIGRGLAHGFLSLTDDVLVVYAMSAPYVPAAARGARYDDPALGVPWPAAPSVVGERDRSWPPLEQTG